MEPTAPSAWLTNPTEMFNPLIPFARKVDPDFKQSLQDPCACAKCGCDCVDVWVDPFGPACLLDNCAGHDEFTCACPTCGFAGVTVQTTHVGTDVGAANTAIDSFEELCYEVMTHRLEDWNKFCRSLRV